MKCPSCGYEKRTVSKEVDKVVRYQSGKRKGEIKSIEKENITFYEHDPDFIKIEIKSPIEIEFVADSGRDPYWRSHKEVCLYACPGCKTVIMSEDY